MPKQRSNAEQTAMNLPQIEVLDTQGRRENARLKRLAADLSREQWILKNVA
jgi:hypothetical protein